MPPLRLGVVDQSPVRTGGTAADAVRETLELAREAERLGYTRYWLAEHHSTNSFAGSAPEVLIPHVAAATERIRVGSGGVMLSHYAPLKVAEQFRMLETLFPGRIDLGIGRAPGGDARTALALRPGGGFGLAEFPGQIEDLAGWLTDSLPDAHPFRRVRAMPRGSGAPELWLLGSGGSSAEYAAHYGAGYSFAQFISGQDGSALVRAYREHFRPSERMPEPRASVGVSVVCADTGAEAERLASSMELWRRRIMTGRDRGIPSPEEALAELGAGWRPPASDEPGARSIVGDPAAVGAALPALAERYGVDELMVVTVVHEREARLRSYRLLAEVLALHSPG